MAGCSFRFLCRTVIMVETSLRVVFAGSFERVLVVVKRLGQVRVMTSVTDVLVDSFVIQMWVGLVLRCLTMRWARSVTSVGLFVLCFRLFGWN